MNATPSALELRGIAASPGITIGNAYLVDRARLEGREFTLEPREVNGEIRRLKGALEHSGNQVRSLLRRIEALGGGTEHTGILQVHLMMIEDPEFAEGIARRIRERLINVEWALKLVLHELKESFSRIDDEYLKERSHDVDQVGQRILQNLMGHREPTLAQVPPRSIVIAKELLPCDTVHLLKGHILGFATESGTRTSHVAIIARSMEVPAVVGVEGLTGAVTTGDLVILDGETGRVIVRPSEEQLTTYRNRRQRLLRKQKLLEETRHLPAVTKDGTPVTLLANVDKLDELDGLDKSGAEGIGLFRTEYLFLDDKHLPDEDEQVQIYCKLVRRCAPHPVVIRSLDIGADKGMKRNEGDRRALNPALGLRGVRYTLRHPELFEPQLRAVLRAAAFGPVKLMIPMVSCIEEIQSVKETLNRCNMALEADEYALPSRIPLGIMIETPAAALIAPALAREVDFFSIGSNDLIHYTMAADRTDDRLAYLYQPVHPAMLRLFAGVIDAANQAGIEVSMCGEMAGEPLYAPLLLGLGLRRFSMSPMAIPRLKYVIRHLHLDQARAIAEEALAGVSGQAIHDKLVEHYRKLFQ